MTRRMTFTAVCQFDGKDPFQFFAPTFAIEQWTDLEREGEAAVREAWESIVPGPLPRIVEYIPGALVFVPDREASRT